MINASEIFSLPFMMFVYSIVLNGGIVQHGISLTKDEDEELINQFYNYFEDGYKFEEFLKAYLEKIGLEEVVVTQRSRDGGIDLTAVRNGIGDLGGQDYIKYCVQAKRYKPSSNISIDTVKAFAYNVDKYHSTGIFITTAKFSKPTRIEFEKLRNPPIILIDGKTLIDSCIDNELGFIYKSIFNSQSMNELMSLKSSIENTSEYQTNDEFANSFKISVEKKITANDIRAQILSIPKIIFDNIDAKQTSIMVSFNNEISKELSINKGRNYLAGITEVYRKYGLIATDGTINVANSYWQLVNGKLFISIEPL